MKIYKAGWVVPVSSVPVRRGAVAVRDGLVFAVGSAEDVIRAVQQGPGEPCPAGSVEIEDLGDAVLAPAFVNAHTHLELSWMRANPVLRGGFMDWVRAMITRIAPSPETIQAAIRAAIVTIESSGTAAVGDVGNGTEALPMLRASRLAGRFFLETIGARSDDADARFCEAVRRLTALPGAKGAFPASIVPHGPHSVSAPLLRRIGEAAAADGSVISVHLAESQAELDLLLSGTGPFRELLEGIGAIGRGWRPPGLSPARVLDEAGLLGPRTIAVHGVHLDCDDAALLAARGATLALCPRSNTMLGVGDAPVGMLLAAGVRIALGTDSLASNTDLDIMAELAALRRLAHDADPASILRAATLSGAEALGLGRTHGSIETGKRASIIALRREPAGPDRLAPRPAILGTGTHASPPGPRGHGRDAEPYATLFAGPGGVRVIRIEPR